MSIDRSSEAFGVGDRVGARLLTGAADFPLVRLLDLERRTEDLLPIARNHYHHRDQRGSWSIKAVLPTSAPELDHAGLEIKDGAILFTCIDWAHLHEMLEAGHAIFDELKNIVCWAKTYGGMGSLYRSQHELIPVWKKGKAPHVDNIELGAHGR